MKVEKKDDVYEIEIDNHKYNLEMILVDIHIVFIIHDNIDDTTFETYEKSFTMGGFIDVDKKFRAFFSIQEVFQDISTCLIQKNFELIKDENSIIITFQILDKKIPITFPRKQEKNKNESLCEVVCSFSNEIKSLKEECDKLKKINEELGKKNEELQRVSFIKIQNELENLQKSHINESNSHGEKLSSLLSESEKEENKNESSVKQELMIDKLMTKHIFRGNSSPVYCICLLKDERLASSSADHTIKVYNLTSYNCDFIIPGHTGAVNYLSLLDSGCLLSSSADHTMKIWEINTNFYHCIYTIVGHEDWVNMGIQINSKELASCSYDKQVKIWNNSMPYNCIITLRKHTWSVNSIIELSNHRYLVSGGDECLCFWDHINYQCEKVVSPISCLSSNSLVELTNNRLAVGGGASEEGEIAIVNTLTFEIEWKIKQEGYNYFYSFVLLDDKTLLSGCTIKNINSFIQVNTDSYEITKVKGLVHDGIVSGLIRMNNLLISCSFDNTVKIWQKMKIV